MRSLPFPCRASAREHEPYLENRIRSVGLGRGVQGRARGATRAGTEFRLVKRAFRLSPGRPALHRIRRLLDTTKTRPCRTQHETG
jgi:hypothetical protein